MSLVQGLRDALALGCAVASVVCLAACDASTAAPKPEPSRPDFDKVIDDSARRMIDDGRKIFRYDTFGDEAFWGDTLKLHRAVAGEKQGGVGPGVSPKTA